MGRTRAEVTLAATAHSRFRALGASVLGRAAADLTDTPCTVLLADEHGDVLARADGGHYLGGMLPHREPRAVAATVRDGCARRAMRRAIDRGEPVTAVEPAVVDGHADRLAVAAVPVTDPARERAIGVIGGVCPAGSATFLMPYVKELGRTVEDGLLDEASPGRRALVAQFVRTRRRARGAVVGIDGHVMLTNAAAARFVDDDDHAELWRVARECLARGGPALRSVRLSDGSTVRAQFTAVGADGPAAGALVRLDRTPAAPRRDPRSTPGTPAPRLGWSSLTPAQRGVAELVAAGLSNREVAARLFLSRHTVDSHLRQVFTRLGIASRVDLARLVAQLDRSAESRRSGPGAA